LKAREPANATLPSASGQAVGPHARARHAVIRAPTTPYPGSGFIRGWSVQRTPSWSTTRLLGEPGSDIGSVYHTPCPWLDTRAHSVGVPSSNRLTRNTVALIPPP
jgi:hypothetical protein